MFEKFENKKDKVITNLEFKRIFQLKPVKVNGHLPIDSEIGFIYEEILRTHQSSQEGLTTVLDKKVWTQWADK